jgi:hypothetical protein
MSNGLTVVGSARVTKPAVEMKGTDKGSFFRFTIDVSRSTGRKGDDNKTIYERDFYTCEVWVNKDEAGSRAREVIMPKIQKGRSGRRLGLGSVAPMLSI